MAIDFSLTSRQRALQLECREFAVDVLANARATEVLPTLWQPGSCASAFQLRQAATTLA
jgi:hypothetical protein